MSTAVRPKDGRIFCRYDATKDFRACFECDHVKCDAPDYVACRVDELSKRREWSDRETEVLREQVKHNEVEVIAVAMGRPRETVLKHIIKDHEILRDYIDTLNRLGMTRRAARIRKHLEDPV